MSSIRQDTGSNTEAALELGRQLTDYLHDSDALGHWISHHLAELITAAENEHETTIEQRRQIVSTILEVWAHRRNYPRRLMVEFSPVFAALERLGDDRPWAFSRLLSDFDDIEAFSSTQRSTPAPLVTTAIELERLTRETLVLLVWKAATEASVRNTRWLALADKLESTMESRTTNALRRLRRRTGTTHQERTDTDEPAAIDMTIPHDGTEESAKDAAYDDPSNEFDFDPEAISTLEDHARKLRRLADLLHHVADTLTTDTLTE